MVRLGTAPAAVGACLLRRYPTDHVAHGYPLESPGLDRSVSRGAWPLAAPWTAAGRALACRGDGPLVNAPNRPLEGRVAVVTGGAARLGRHVAEALGAQGVHVVVHYRRSAEAAREVVATLGALGVEAWSLAADLHDLRAAGNLIAEASEACGRPIDILVNSASVFDPSSVMDFAFEELAGNVRVNAWAPLALSRALAAQGRPAQIVNFLDARVVKYDRQHAAYHLSKRMLFTLTRMLALELAPSIRVNAVAPGLILPPVGKDASYLESLAAQVPLRRHGGPADIVRAVLFLVQSEFVTGQVIFVDGGSHLMGSTYGL